MCNDRVGRFVVKLLATTNYLNNTIIFTVTTNRIMHVSFDRWVADAQSSPQAPSVLCACPYAKTDVGDVPSTGPARQRNKSSIQRATRMI